MQLRLSAAVALIGSAPWLPSPASAVPVLYRFTAEIAAVYEGDPTLLPVGTQIAGSFVVDTAAAPQGPSQDRFDTGVTKSAYGFYGDATLDVPGFSFEFPDLGIYHVVVFDDHECTVEQAHGDPTLCFPDRAAPTDEFDFGVSDDFFDSTSGWYADLAVQVEESGDHPTMLDSIMIHAMAPQSANGVTSGALWLAHEGGDRYSADLTAVAFSSQVLPEPGGLVLVTAIGSIVCGLRSRSPRRGGGGSPF